MDNNRADKDNNDKKKPNQESPEQLKKMAGTELVISKNPNSDRDIYLYLEYMVEKEASDLFLTVGVAGVVRIKSDLYKIKETKHNNDDLLSLVRNFLTEEQWMEFNSTLELNVALSTEDGERFRVNIFYQQRNIGLVVRHIKSVIPTFEELGLPEAFQSFIMEKRGLFLVVGSTGSGKSTSLASMLEYRNQHGQGHVVTIEDPIEYVFEHKNCIFTQREVNIDTYSYGIALKNALRQAPDVLFIGEIRDRDSMENAIMFSETGHLVVATIHANNTNQTFERILSFYPEEIHNQILVSLSHNLNNIVGQRLVKDTSGNLQLAYEILKNEGLITDLIKEGKFMDMKEIIFKNVDNGMMTFDECLYRMFRNRTISKDTALKEADNPNNLRLRISQYADSNISQNLRGYAKTTISDDE
jgi:twitching motility protein PilU